VGGVMKQRQVFLSLTAFIEPFAEAVVSLAEPCRREQIVAEDVVRECSRLPHQRVDHMAVMHRMLVPTDQPGQRVGELVRVPDLDAVSEEPGFHPFADQSAMHRVGAAVNVDQAARIDAATHLEATRQPHIRQRLQRRDLFREAISTSFVADLHHLLKEANVIVAAGEVSTASQQQRLLDGDFEVVMRRLGIAVFMGLSNIDPLGREAVVGQKIAISGLELPRRGEVVDGGGEAVAAMSSGNATEFPESVLQAIGECLERLGQADGDGLPVGVSENEVVDQVIEGLPCNGDAERVHVGEVGSSEIARVMNLSEDGEFAGSVCGPPLPNSPLECAFV
jgi:hypothetical protein